MISYKKSKIILKKSVIKLGEEFLNPNKCLNRVTSKNIYVHSYYPSGNNAAFDGYAIKSNNTHKLNKKIYQKFKIKINYIALIIFVIILSIVLILLYF